MPKSLMGANAILGTLGAKTTCPKSVCANFAPIFAKFCEKTGFSPENDPNRRRIRAQRTQISQNKLIGSDFGQIFIFRNFAPILAKLARILRKIGVNFVIAVFPT